MKKKIRIITQIVLFAITLSLLYSTNVSAAEQTATNKFGTVTGTVTWYYNDFKGHVPDTNAVVLLIPKTNYLRDKPIDVTKQDLTSYGIYEKEVNGKGKYLINHVKAGKYYAIIMSSHVVSKLSYTGFVKKSYIKVRANRLNNSMDNILHPKTARSIIEWTCGHMLYSGMEVIVYDHEKTDLSQDFGKTYIDLPDQRYYE